MGEKIKMYKPLNKLDRTNKRILNGFTTFYADIGIINNIHANFSFGILLQVS